MKNREGLTCLTSENWEKGLLGPLGQPSIGQL